MVAYRCARAGATAASERPSASWRRPRSQSKVTLSLRCCSTGRGSLRRRRSGGSALVLLLRSWGSVKALRWNSHINYECAAHPGADEAALSPTFVKVQVVTTGSLVVALVSSILKCFHIHSQFQAYYV